MKLTDEQVRSLLKLSYSIVNWADNFGAETVSTSRNAYENLNEFLETLRREGHLEGLWDDETKKS